MPQPLASLARLEAERLFHDRQAQERAEKLSPCHLRFSDEDYLDHESWIRPAIAKLGDLADKELLDYGCGHGMASVVFARSGARVTGFDLSAGYVAEAERRTKMNEVEAKFVVANAEELPFPDASFDCVWGHAILHHVDLERAGAELVRILKPGGVAVFCEPWGGNPFLEFARRYLPYPAKKRTRDEQPLQPTQRNALARFFPTMTVEGHQLLGMARRLLGENRLVQQLHRLDHHLIRQCPHLKWWCRYVVLVLKKDYHGEHVTNPASND